jgi:hypothetical protein
VRFDDSSDIIIVVSYREESREAKGERRNNKTFGSADTAYYRAISWSAKQGQKMAASKARNVENEQETIDASPFLPKASIPFLLLPCPYRERGLLSWRMDCADDFEASNETSQVPCAVTVGLSLVSIIQTCNKREWLFALAMTSALRP